MDEPNWLTADQIEDWKALVALTLALPAALDRQLKRDSCVTSFEYHVMAALSESPGRSLPMSVLATLASGSMSRVSHVVARLEQSGWVERQSSQLTGCRTEAHLTDAGWSKVQQTAPGHVEEARRLVVDVLTPDELGALGAAARKIVQVADPRLAPRLSGADPSS
ncbi:MAG TPA: MarR family transcriptional regulator [Propionicimonas sp.]|uniref:MarR family winged helix-turn-helix transcriptional regulator n=1 Tax=Propionicimonas sp. TaxID=1955623 RepID=UPI002F42DC6C